MANFDLLQRLLSMPMPRCKMKLRPMVLSTQTKREMQSWPLLPALHQSRWSSTPSSAPNLSIDTSGSKSRCCTLSEAEAVEAFSPQTTVSLCWVEASSSLSTPTQLQNPLQLFPAGKWAMALMRQGRHLCKVLARPRWQQLLNG